MKRFLFTCGVALAAIAPPALCATTPASDAKIDLTGLADGGRYDRFIVRYRDGSDERRRLASAAQAASVSLARALPSVKRSAAPAVLPVRQMTRGGTVMKLTTPLSAVDASTFMRTLATDPAVEHVEPDLLMHATRASVTAMAAPDDPYYADVQWDLSDPIGGINLPAMWNSFPDVDGSGVTVAVIDTGITDHDDLDTSLASDGYDFIADRLVSGRTSDGRVAGGWDLGDWTTEEPWKSACDNGGRLPEASSWHGTNVAGVIAERTGNGIGTAGVAPGAKVLPVRALGHCGGYTSDIADAIVWASGGHVDGVPDNTHPAQVINMSLGGSGACAADGVTRDAIATAIGRGTTVVVAAGNSSDDASNYTPASCPGVVTVAATGITGRVAFYSNFGLPVSLSAPGGGIHLNDGPDGDVANPQGFIWAAYNAGTTTPVSVSDGGAVYGGMAGTSQATPHVSATVALMLDAARRANLASPTPDQIKTMLMSSARPFVRTPTAPIGSGVLDAQGAVAAILGVALPPQIIPLISGQMSVSLQRAQGQSAIYSIAVPAGARNLVIRSVGGTGDVSLYASPGQVPDAGHASVTSSHPGNTEAVAIVAPTPGTWYVRLTAEQDSGGVRLLATYLAH